MKKIIALLISITFQQIVFAQNLPSSPSKIEFATVMVNLDNNAQRAVNNEIYNLLTTNEKYQDTKLQRIQLYFPIIEKILLDENVPDDVKYLCVLESSVNPDAVSSTNAIGFWQFKDFTAKEMGLKMDNQIDERKNIQASTRAAALYLKKNNLIYKNWVSSLLTFSLGVNGASSIIPVDWSFANEIKFDSNTPPYLLKALANKIAYEYKLNRLNNSNQKYVEYPTNGKSLAIISSELNIPVEQLKASNSWILGDEIPSDKVYNMVVLTNMDTNIMMNNINSTASTSLPAGNLDYPKLKRLTNVTTNLEDPVFYEINGKKGILAQNGMEIPQLAKKSKIKIRKMLRFNDMKSTDVAKEGNVYYLQKKNKRADTKYYTLAPNETLWDVAQKYGVRKKRLLKYNRISNNTQLLPGSVLYLTEKRPRKMAMQIIPQTFDGTDKGTDYNTAIVPQTTKTEIVDNTVDNTPKPVVTPTPQPTKATESNSDALEINDPLFTPKEPKTTTSTSTYTPKYTPATSTNTTVSKGYYRVQPQETLFSIAKQHGMSVAQLRSLNGMSPTETLQSGQLLKVSGNPSAATYTKPVETKEEVVKSPISTNDGNFTYHKVAQGETMYSIAKKYNMPISTIQKLNGIGNYNLEVDQMLKVGQNNISKVANSTARNSTGLTKHQVAVGETLFSISRKYGVSVDNLKNWNNLPNNNISVGSYLTIKR